MTENALSNIFSKAVTNVAYKKCISPLAQKFSDYISAKRTAKALDNIQDFIDGTKSFDDVLEDYA